MDRIDLGHPTILEFCGPDAVRFLNGQLTQDVRRVVGGQISLPSCVTDAKGRLQFRVTLTEAGDGVLWIEGLAEWAETLETRLTRYLIADDVETSDLTGRYGLVHFLGEVSEVPEGVISRKSNRFGIDGTDWWVPSGFEDYPDPSDWVNHDELEDLRIRHRIPVWGCELVEGMLPPEALLEATDISYNKGCYIGQEVISRIKSAGKVNRQLSRFRFDENLPIISGPLENETGMVAGEITSVSPLSHERVRFALGFVKRGAGDAFFRTADGLLVPARVG